MRLRHGTSCAALGAAAITGLGAACPARVSAEPFTVGGTYAVNGTYTAVSDGQWAKTLGSFHDEATITSTWTVISSCDNPFRCTGHVTSDQGWSADTHSESGLWYVSRDIDHWQPCADGTGQTGHQTYMFYPQDPATLVGMDKVIGDSGACGVNLPLVIEMPFTLTRKP